jgi:RND family efflux transporter MFP subunit
MQAQANLTQAELDFGRISTLWEQESITKPTYDASKARLDVARAGVDAAKAAIAAAQKRQDSARAQMREAEIALGDTELRSPFAATVLDRRVELGSLAAAGAPAFTLADLTTLKARFNVPDYALTEFRQGQSLDLSIDAFPGQRFAGRVLAIAAAADPKARSFEIEVVIQNSGSKLRSGMIATVLAGGIESGEAQVQVPVAALVHDPTGKRYLVYTIEQSSGRPIAKAITVEPGPLAGNRVVVHRGLQPGQKIVIMGANLLQPGDAVQERVPDTAKEFDDIKIKLDSLTDLPDGAGPIQYIKEFGETSALMLTVASPPADGAQLDLLAGEIEKKIAPESINILVCGSGPLHHSFLREALSY